MCNTCGWEAFRAEIKRMRSTPGFDWNGYLELFGRQIKAAEHVTPGDRQYLADVVRRTNDRVFARAYVQSDAPTDGTFVFAIDPETERLVRLYVRQALHIQEHPDAPTDRILAWDEALSGTRRELREGFRRLGYEVDDDDT